MHGTASTANSVSLAWDKVNTGASPTTGYTVYANGAKVATTKGTSTTVKGLRAGTGYSFTVVANDAKGRRSAPSKAVPVTTPAAGGPTGIRGRGVGQHPHRQCERLRLLGLLRRQEGRQPPPGVPWRSTTSPRPKTAPTS